MTSRPQKHTRPDLPTPPQTHSTATVHLTEIPYEFHDYYPDNRDMFIDPFREEPKVHGIHEIHIDAIPDRYKWTTYTSRRHENRYLPTLLRMLMRETRLDNIPDARYAETADWLHNITLAAREFFIPAGTPLSEILSPTLMHGHSALFPNTWTSSNSNFEGRLSATSPPTLSFVG